MFQLLHQSKTESLVYFCSCLFLDFTKQIHQRYFSAFAGCPLTFASSLPDINGPFSCSLGDSCTDIICCLNMDPLSTYLTFRVNLDYCQDKITITVDKFQTEMKVSKFIASGNLS